MQTGVGLSKIIFILGAGYTGTILVKNGKLSDIIGELQGLVKGLENSGDSANIDSDPIAAQVRWLAQEVRQLASARQITVVNGGGSGQTDVTSLIVPAATLGALGYGYMWWKGFSFSDLMYVTKRNMTTAVENLTKHLESVSDALAKAKRHLTQRIENLDGKMDEQMEISKLMLNDVNEARGDINKVSSQIYSLTHKVLNLEGKMDTLDDKQNHLLMGVDYLCQFADGKRAPGFSQFVQERLKGSGKPRAQLPPADCGLGLQGLFELAEGLATVKEIRSITNGDCEFNDQPSRNLIRTTSAKAAVF